MTPSVGRIVHVVENGTCAAAVVTAVLDGGPGIGIDSISVCVIGTRGLTFARVVVYDDETKAPGTWHVPERVGEP